MVDNLSIEDLKKVLIAAIKKLYAEDRALIERKVYEVAIAHRLAVHIENALSKSVSRKYHVDIEYDKDMEQSKMAIMTTGS